MNELRLEKGCQQLRLTFAQWALRKLDEGVTFVFTLETWIELGPRRRRKRRFSRPKGPNPHDNAREKFKSDLQGYYVLESKSYGL